MPLRLNHAVMTWLPTDRNRVVLFYTFIPQFYYSELPPTSINSAVMHEHAHHLDPVRARPLAAPVLCATCQAFAQLAQHQRANLLVALFNRLTGGLVWQVTVDLISNRDKSEMKDVVRDHLADNQGEAVPAYSPSDYAEPNSK